MRARRGTTLLLVVLAAAACSVSADDTTRIVAAEPPGTAPAQTTVVDQPTTAEPTTSPTADLPADPEGARLVVETIGPGLALNEPELACLTQRLGDQPQLVKDAQAPDLASDSKAYVEVATIGQSCADAVRFGPLFAQAAQDESGGRLSEEQMACLQNAYSTLSSDEIRANTAAALNPEDKKSQETNSQAIARLRDGCGV